MNNWHKKFDFNKHCLHLGTVYMVQPEQFYNLFRIYKYLSKTVSIVHSRVLTDNYENHSFGDE